jgi:hypothetical protein
MRVVVNIRFACSSCDHPARLELPLPAQWQCPACDHLLQLPDSKSAESLTSCAICGNTELYKKKDFPHWLGMGILTIACVAFLVINGYRYHMAAWAILLGSALFDGLLYAWVGDVTVCYRCNAHFRGFPAGEAQKPHDLGIAERYRQERIRREQIEAERKSTS